MVTQISPYTLKDPYDFYVIFIYPYWVPGVACFENLPYVCVVRGSRMYLNGAKVVDNDGCHGETVLSWRMCQNQSFAE